MRKLNRGSTGRLGKEASAEFLWASWLRVGNLIVQSVRKLSLILEGPGTWHCIPGTFSRLREKKAR